MSGTEGSGECDRAEKSLLEEAQQSGLRSNNTDIPDDLGARPAGSGLRSTSGAEKKVQMPRIAMVCVDCESLYSHNSTWTFCPQCGEELMEVEKA